MQSRVAIAALSEMPPEHSPEYDPMEMYRQVIVKFLRDWQPNPYDIHELMAAGDSTENFTHEKLYDELSLWVMRNQIKAAQSCTHYRCQEDAVKRL